MMLNVRCAEGATAQTWRKGRRQYGLVVMVLNVSVGSTIGVLATNVNPAAKMILLLCLQVIQAVGNI